MMPGPGLRRQRRVLRGLPVRVVGRLQPDRRTSAPGILDGLPEGCLDRPRVRRHHRPARAQDPGIAIYESQIERLFDGTRAMADAVRAYGRDGRRVRRGRRRRPSATGSTGRV